MTPEQAHTSLVGNTGFQCLGKDAVKLHPKTQHRRRVYERACVYAIQKGATDDPICRAKMEGQSQRTDLGDTAGEREGGAN